MRALKLYDGVKRCIKIKICILTMIVPILFM